VSTPETESIDVVLPDGRRVEGRWTEAIAPAAGCTFVYAPGAGSNIDDGFGAFASHSFACEGIATLRFQFPYMQEKKRFPDRQPVLEATWRAAIALARERGLKLAIGGRSLGGRIASYLAASGEPLDALTCFAYPLHPPGRPDQRRDEHLAQIKIPMLVCSGTRDTFGTPDELRAALAGAPRAALHLLEGADHGFNILKSSGRLRPHVWAEAAETASAWLKAL
jgi:uncharacterized protein